MSDTSSATSTSLPPTCGYPLSGLNHPLLRGVKANFALLYDAVTNVSRPHARALGVRWQLTLGLRRGSTCHL